MARGRRDAWGGECLWGGRLLIFGAAVLVVVAFGYPVGYGVVRAVEWAAGGGRVAAVESAVSGLRALELLGRTLVYAGGIAVLAAVLAWPVAWTMWGGGGARVRPVAAGLCAVPLLLPHYFAYAGWGLLRGPRTWVGDWLAGGPAWRLTVASEGIAVWGLALWAWPLALLVLWPGVRRVGGGTMESLAVDGAGWRARAGVVLGQTWAAWGTAVLVVMLVMLGSLVPLDVANVPTYSIALLRLVTSHPEVEAAWIGSWPLVAIAVLAGWFVTRRLRAAPELEAGEAGGSRVRPARAWRMGAEAVWVMAVMMPAVLFLVNMREPPRGPSAASVARLSGAFWREYGEAVASSAGTGLAVGAMGMLIGAAVWLGLSGRDRWGVRGGAWLLRVLVVAGLVPGVVLGTMMARAWNVRWGGEVASWVQDSPAILVLAHVARFGMVGAIAGWWLSRQETREVRDLRLVDGGTGVRGWLGACAAARWPGLVGAGLGMAVLSFHEIETAVQVSPPGISTLAQKLLEALHYARDERLAAGAVNLMGAGVVAALLVGWMMARVGRSGRNGGA